MDPTYLSLLLFAIITLVYYLVKPKLSVDTLFGETITKKIIENGVEVEVNETISSDDAMANYTKKNYLYLLIYVLLTVVSQFFINVSIIVNKCGGSLKDNFSAAAIMTFLPWTFIFGSVVLSLIVFPGFKSAFSNVVGYFIVAGQANEILNKLLVHANMQEAINTADTTPEKKAGLQKAAEAIIKLCGNTSIMINQMVPENFVQYWSILQPLMKDEYQQPSSELSMLQEQLLGTVVMRDTIGEIMWYIYTAVLLISIVQYNIATRGCVLDAATVKANHDKYLEEEAAKIQQNETASQQVYAS